MYTYSITSLDTQHMNEIIADIRDQYRRGISSCPLFMIKLVPEGNPVWDKAEREAAKFAMFKKELDRDNIPVGILVQATIGHRPGLSPSPFQKYVSLIDGTEQGYHCPMDERFLAHMRGQFKRIASEHPHAIMIDDDFRLTARPAGQGCACPAHMAEFNRRAGTKMTREELYSHIMSHPDGDPLTEIFLDVQRDSLVAAARAFREGVDAADPGIQGINCTSGDYCESVEYTSKIWAGKGNPTIVRLPNGTYVPESAKTISDTMRRCAACSAKLRRAGVDILLAETDTIPFNRYGKSARYLHTHFTLCFLDGLYGAKHWITRLSAFEPESGKAFRNILAEHYSYYEAIHSLVKDGVKWVGANSAFIVQDRHKYHAKDVWRYHDNSWVTRVLERMGIPFYFSDGTETATFLEDNIVCDMTDEQIRAFFDGSVFMTSEVARDLTERGFGDLIGVTVAPHEPARISGETYDGTLSFTSTKQKNHMRITPTSERTEVLSHNYENVDGNVQPISPAVTCYEREGGKLSVVYCGTPKAAHNYMEGFAFLNETRKKQFIKLLSKAGALPIYYTGDIEMLVHAGYLSDGRLLASFSDLGYDPEDTLNIYLEREPKSIRLLDKEGELGDVAYRSLGEGRYSVGTRVEPMYPVILVIEL